MSQRVVYIVDGRVKQISWIPDGRQPDAGWELSEVARLDDVKQQDGTYARPAAVPPRIISPLDFARLFTQQERIAIRTRRAAADAVAAVIDDWYALLELAGTVNLDHPDVAAGLTYMVAQGLLEDARRTAILAGTLPASR